MGGCLAAQELGSRQVGSGNGLGQLEEALWRGEAARKVPVGGDQCNGGWQDRAHFFCQARGVTDIERIGEIHNGTSSGVFAINEMESTEIQKLAGQ